MAANRLLDARLDSLNPRTAGRALPSGRLSRRFYLTILLLCTSSFILLTSFFYWLYKNPWPLVLSVPVLLYISVYPLLKRFSRLCHYYLGAALGLAPICAWLAVTPHLILPPLLMAAAVLLWTAGFDIIYACQDYQSDLETGVISIPVRLGLPRALWLSRLTHLLSLLLLIALGFSTPYFSTLYFTGVTAAAVLLIIEHALVRPQDLTKVGLAFFTMNGLISLLLGALGMLDLFF
jgi:4-hydroxybenzoate polyprenyltransferase